jgi:hypothetical protein
MGKAGLLYARSVQQTHPLSRNMLPDAGLVFDSLLKRKKVGYTNICHHVDVYGF